MGGILPKAIKHPLLHNLHLGKNEQDREGGKSGLERESEREGTTTTILKSIVYSTSLGKRLLESFSRFWPSVTFMNSAVGNWVFGLFGMGIMNH